jgi:hypothetical protein
MRRKGALSNEQTLMLQSRLNEMALGQEEKKIPIEAKREETVGGIRSKQAVDQARQIGDNALLNRNDLPSSRATEFDQLVGPEALLAAQTEKQRLQSSNIQAKKQADLQSKIIDTTGEQTVDNAGFSADKFKRNAEAEYINQFLKPVGEGQQIVDTRFGNVVAKGGVKDEALMQALGQQPLQQNQAAVRNYQRVPLSNGMTAVKAIPTQQPEKATEVVTQQTPPDTTNVWNQKPFMLRAKPEQPAPVGGDWILVNGRYVRRPQPKITSIPR